MTIPSSRVNAASTTVATYQADPSPTPTPTPGSATSNNPAPVTLVPSTLQSTSTSTSHPGSPTVQDASLATPQRAGAIPAAYGSSSQGPVPTAAQNDASQAVGLSKTQFGAVIGSTIAAVALINIFLFALYLKRKRKASSDLFCLVKEPPSSPSMMMRVEPFVQTGEVMRTTTNLGTEPSIQGHSLHRSTGHHCPPCPRHHGTLLRTFSPLCILARPLVARRPRFWVAPERSCP